MHRASYIMIVVCDSHRGRLRGRLLGGHLPANDTSSGAEACERVRMIVRHAVQFALRHGVLKCIRSLRAWTDARVETYGGSCDA